MRNLAFVPLALLCIGAAPPEPQTVPARPAPELNPHNFDRMNLMRSRPDCVSVPRQVAGEERRPDGTRLDRQPPGRMILAVQREVNGCPEVVFAGGQRRALGPDLQGSK